MEPIDDTRGPYCEAPRHDRRNERRLLGWMVLWTAGWLAVLLAFRFEWLAEGAAGIAAAAAAAVLGIPTFLAFRRFLRQTDELRRQIQLEALAFAFGVGIVGGFAYILLAAAGVFAEAEVDNVIALMCLAYPLGVLLGHRRYA